MYSGVMRSLEMRRVRKSFEKDIIYKIYKIYIYIKIYNTLASQINLLVFRWDIGN